MKKLQNESEIYIKNIINMVENCYANSEPTTSENDKTSTKMLDRLV